jgi:hypothetical protein
MIGLLLLTLLGSFLIAKRYGQTEFQRGFRKGFEFGLKQRIK